jgi:hypothetical protein
MPTCTSSTLPRRAHVRVLEAPGAGGRRYVCAAHTLHRGELCRILAGQGTAIVSFPGVPYWPILKSETLLVLACFSLQSRSTAHQDIPKRGYKFTNQPLKDLGIKFTPVHIEYLYGAVRSLREDRLNTRSCRLVSEFALHTFHLLERERERGGGGGGGG